MVPLRNYMMTLFGLFFLTQCNTKEDNPTFAPTIALTKVDNNPLVGEWKYASTIWYSSELILHDNRTFTYHDQGCYGQRFSQGQWTRANGSISLTSFDTFKEKEQVEATKTAEATEQHKTEPKLEKEKVEYSFVGFKETAAADFPSANDTIRVYLDNLQLQLRNDTLYCNCIGSNKLPEEAKFYRTKNNH